MAKIYVRKKTLLAKPEVTYGVDPTPTGALNAILTKDLEIEPLEGEQLDRDTDKDTFGSNLQTLVGKMIRLRFKVEVAGAGAAGDIPAYGVLLRACGMSETNSAGVDTQYKFIDDAVPSLHFYFKRDKVLHKVAGARGMFKITTGKRKYAYYEFEFIGLFVAPVVAGAITPVLTAFVKPVPFRASTVSCSLISNVVGLHEATIDGGQKVEFYEHSEEESVQITDRKAKIDATFEEPEIGTHDYYADVNAETTGALDYQHGTVAGNIVQITATMMQLTTIKPSDQQGVAALQVTGPLVPNGANSDFTIIVK